MVVMASGIARGRVRTTAATTTRTTVSRNMAAMLSAMHPQFVADVCHLFFAEFSKTGKQTIAEVDLKVCTEATKEKKSQKARINSRRRAAGQRWGRRRNSTE